MAPLKRSVSLVVRAPGEEGLLLVRRPDDDESLPGVWGLPAITLRDGEAERDAVRRAGREKLGVAVQPLALLGEARAGRGDHEILMRDWEARLVAGEPAVPQPYAGTQYVEWRWGPAEAVAPAARQGSLCSQVLLRSRGLAW